MDQRFTYHSFLDGDNGLSRIFIFKIELKSLNKIINGFLDRTSET